MGSHLQAAADALTKIVQNTAARWAFVANEFYDRAPTGHESFRAFIGEERLAQERRIVCLTLAFLIVYSVEIAIRAVQWLRGRERGSAKERVAEGEGSSNPPYVCRICHAEDARENLVQPCSCRGTQARARSPTLAPARLRFPIPAPPPVAPCLLDTTR